MRTVFLFGRQCLRQGLRQSAQYTPHHFQRAFSARIPFHGRFFRPPPPIPGRTLRFATLSPLAFVSLSQHDSEDGRTHEEAMLEASRKELKEHVPKALQGSRKVRRGIYFFIDMYIIEPIATGLRLLHLVVIFVPVLVTIPSIWFGKRQPGHDNERSGTLWWYGFLVRSMERAGATFIKVISSSIEGMEIC